MDTLIRRKGRRDEQVNSLAEVVLQHGWVSWSALCRTRRLLYGLGETCCFYANYLGIIRNKLYKIQKYFEEDINGSNFLSTYPSIYLFSLILFGFHIMHPDPLHFHSLQIHPLPCNLFPKQNLVQNKRNITKNIRKEY